MQMQLHIGVTARRYGPSRMVNESGSEAVLCEKFKLWGNFWMGG